MRRDTRLTSANAQAPRNAMLAESLEVIQRTSAVILAAIRDNESTEAATEREQFAAAS